jgi:hypothetical protein
LQVTKENAAPVRHPFGDPALNGGYRPKTDIHATFDMSVCETAGESPLQD